MPEQEGNGPEDKANWKAQQEGQEASETKEENDEVTEVKFDPNHRPGIPRGATFKGPTVFHKMAELWDEAKIEHDQGGQGEAAQRYEEYSNFVNRGYEKLTESMRAAAAALQEAGLTERTEKGRAMYQEVRQKYLDEHREEPPAWASERWPKKENK